MSTEESSCESAVLAETPDWLVNGGFIPVILGIIVNFWGFTFICEEYGIPVLTAFCKRYQVPDAFAGSIIIGTGLSLPVFFVALASMFVSNASIGVGAVVGGNLFNHLVTIAVTIWISPGRAMKLDAVVFARESIIYLLSCLLLIWAIHVHSFAAAFRDAFERDTWSDCLSISWFGSLVLTCCYPLYCLIERYADHMDVLLSWFFPAKNFPSADCLPPSQSPSSPSTMENGESSPESPSTPSLELLELTDAQKSTLSSPPSSTDPSLPLDAELEMKLAVAKVQSMLDSTFDTADGYQRMFIPPAELPDQILFYISLPLRCLIYLTIPDVRRPGNESKIFLSMAMGVVWLALQAYLLTLCLTLIGDWWGIRGSVMGLTIAAWASNFPAHWSSKIVARYGFGDVSCCNCLGSNVFNILIGLGLPWLLYNLYHGGAPYTVLQDSGVVIMVLMMMAVTVLVMCMLAWANWTLTVPMIPVMLAMYIGCIVYLCYLDSSL